MFLFALGVDSCLIHSSCILLFLCLSQPFLVRARSDDEFKEGRGTSRKEWIENLIRDSKKRKAEKRKLEEETEERTKELDQSWKQLLGNIRGSGLVRHNRGAPEQVRHIRRAPEQDSYNRGAPEQVRHNRGAPERQA